MKTFPSLIIAAVSVLVGLSACSKGQPKETSIKDWNDFVITDDSHLPNFVTSPKNQDCEAKIRKIICLVDPSPTKNSSRRLCLPGSDVYQTPILKIYKTLPAQFQKMFCTLKVIYIERETTSIAYAGFATGSGNVRSNFMGIRQSVLDQDLPAGDVLSWKEQKLFGAKAPAYERNPQLPLVALKSSGAEAETATDPDASPTESPTASPLLTYILLHEMGHLFDYNNELTRYRCLNESCSRNKLERSSWGYGPFDSEGRVNAKSALAPYRDFICFYDRKKPSLQPEQALEFYESLKTSEFLTAYSAESPYENFAEATASYFMKSLYRQKLSVELEGSEHYDIGEKYDSPAFAKSKKAVEKFYSGRIHYGW